MTIWLFTFEKVTNNSSCVKIIKSITQSNNTFGTGSVCLIINLIFTWNFVGTNSEICCDTFEFCLEINFLYCWIKPFSTIALSISFTIKHRLFARKERLAKRKKTTLISPRIYIVGRIRISYFLALSLVARFYATTEQKLIHSFWNPLRIRRKINQLHQSSCYTSSIYYTTQNNPWICRYRFNGKKNRFFSVSPLIHVKF